LVKFTHNITFRLTGRIGAEWCYDVVAPLSIPREADEALCTKHYVDPSDETPTDPEAYRFDCSLGCRKCVYVSVRGTFACRSSPTKITGCPAPSPPV